MTSDIVKAKSNKAWRLECETLRQAIREYDQAYNDVINFTRAYINSGGDQTTPPERWNELDNARQAKYAAMIAAAGVTS